MKNGVCVCVCVRSVCVCVCAYAHLCGKKTASEKCTQDNEHCTALIKLNVVIVLKET